MIEAPNPCDMTAEGRLARLEQAQRRLLELFVASAALDPDAKLAPAISDFRHVLLTHEINMLPVAAPPCPPPAPAVVAPPACAEEIVLTIAATADVTTEAGGRPEQLTVKLRACPKYKPGAYYTGRLRVQTTRFKVKAICVQSTAGGRAWMAWDERLDGKLKLLELDAFRRPTVIDVSLPGAPARSGEYLVVIHPMGESEADADE